MEEPAFLLPVQRIVRGIQIEDDLLWRAPMCLQEKIDEQRLDRRRIVADLVIPRRLRPAQFQPVQRRLPRQRRAVRSVRLKLAGQHRQHRIMPQFIVVDQVLVAERNAEHPLRHHRGDAVFHQFRNPRVPEARCETFGQPDHSIRPTQKQRPSVRSDRPAIKRRHNCAPFHRCKRQQFRVTLCRHGELLCFAVSLCRRRTFADSEPRFTYIV